MVLYYGIQQSTSKEMSAEIHSSSTFEVSDNNKLDINKNPYKVSILRMPEKYSLMEEKYREMSTDDKLNILYSTLTFGLETTTNYILICIALLVIIAIKLYK